jgi:hypothetical protein
VNVGINILGAIVLDDPVHCGEINTTRGDICTKQDGMFSLGEFEIYRSTLGLLLSSMQLEERYSNLEPPEGLIGKADLFARGEEHNAFVLLMAFQEGEERVELLIDLHLHVVMKELNWGDGLQLLC